MSQSFATRTYTPPPAGTFDPYTAAITGAIPSFFTYRQGQFVPAAPAPTPLEELSNLAESGGGDSGGGGGMGGVGVNMGGEMAGSIDLGPNPGNLGNLGSFDLGRLSDISLSDLARGFSLGSLVGGVPGGLVGAAIAAGRSMSAADAAREPARAHAQIHDRAIQDMLNALENTPLTAQELEDARTVAQQIDIDNLTFDEVAPTQVATVTSPTQGLATVSPAAVTEGGLAGLSGLSAADLAQAQANVVAASIDADYGPGGVFGGVPGVESGMLGGGTWGGGDWGSGGGPGGMSAADAAQADANAAAANVDADSQPGGVNDGGGGGGGDSKIVCTAMNAAYGFGSYRNKIWLAYAAKNLTKAHEVGYHTIFQPLVEVAYHTDRWYSKPLKNALEHIARHRSTDLRAEMRNSKRDTLGRIYRAVLEPVCYLVGKVKGH
jgi:hypothetical protein